MAGATRWAAGAVVASLYLAGCAQPASPAGDTGLGQPVPTAAVPLRPGVLPTHPKQVHRDRTDPRGAGARRSSAVRERGRFVQVSAWDSSSVTAAGRLSLHVDHSCAPDPTGATCTLVVTNLEESVPVFAWEFSGPRSTNIASVRPASGVLWPGEWSGPVEVVVTGCPARFALVDDSHGAVTEHDLCLE